MSREASTRGRPEKRAMERFLWCLLFLILMTGAAILLVPSPARGGQPCATPVAPAVLVPAVQIPVTFAAYSPPGAATRDELERRLAAAEKKIEALQSNFVPRIPAGKTLDFRPVVAAKCQNCHAGDADDGGGFVLPSDPTEMSPQKRQRLVSKVTSRSMPPAGRPPLNPEEVDAITAAYKP